MWWSDNIQKRARFEQRFHVRNWFTSLFPANTKTNRTQQALPRTIFRLGVDWAFTRGTQHNSLEARRERDGAVSVGVKQKYFPLRCCLIFFLCLLPLRSPRNPPFLSPSGSIPTAICHPAITPKHSSTSVTVFAFCVSSSSPRIAGRPAAAATAAAARQFPYAPRTPPQFSFFHEVAKSRLWYLIGMEHLPFDIAPADVLWSM